jgi:hypothetical protein
MLELSRCVKTIQAALAQAALARYRLDEANNQYNPLDTRRIRSTPLFRFLTPNHPYRGSLH